MCIRDSGKRCLELLQTEAGQISLVLLDINMPVMDGFEVLRTMNTNHTCLLYTSLAQHGKANGQRHAVLAAGNAHHHPVAGGDHFIVLYSLAPVSYTHLDVYKRQPLDKGG